jgi:integrase
LTVPLTETAVKAAKPKEKAYKKHDERGMYLLVTPAGGKLWRLNYRIDGKQKTFAIGRYPDVPLKVARDLRDEARKQIAAGQDPSTEKRAERARRKLAAAGSFEKVARRWFEKSKSQWVPGHQRTVIARLENDVFPRIGSRPIEDITAVDVLDVLRRIETRGAHETTRRVKQICSQVFTFGITESLITNDPTTGLERALTKPETASHPAVLDPKRIGELLRIFDTYDGTLIVKCALRLAPLVFVRPGELRHAEWTEIDFEKAEWTIPGFKMKRDRSHTVPLSRQAVAILREVQPLTADGKYVFPSARSARSPRPLSDNAVLAAYRRCDIPREELSGHGWRATARTLIAENLETLGLTGPIWESMAEAIIEHQLAHIVKDVHGEAYNRTKFLKERRQMMQAWADYLERLRDSTHAERDRK